MRANNTYTCNYCQHSVFVENRGRHELSCPTMAFNNNLSNHNLSFISRPNQLEPSQIWSSSIISNNSLRVLPSKVITCSDCGDSLLEKDLQEHKSVMCKANHIPCEFCNILFPMQFYTKHLDLCTLNPRNTTRNTINDLIPCETCQQSFNTNEYEQHVRTCIRQRESQPNLSSNPQRREHQNNNPISQQNLRNLAANSPSEDNNTSQALRQEEVREPELPNPRNGNSFLDSISNLLDSLARLTSSIGQNNPPQSRSNSDESNNNSQLNSLERPENSRPSSNDSSLRINVPPLNRNSSADQPESSRFNPSLRHRNNDYQPRSATIHNHYNINNLARINSDEAIRHEVSPRNRPGHNVFSLRRPGEIENPRAHPGMLNLADMTDLLNLLFLRRNEDDFERFIDLLQGNRGLNTNILDSLAVVKYDKEKSKNLDPELKKCCVCLEEFEDGVDVRFLTCLHRFHRSCVDQWLEKNTTCPICKADQNQD